MSDFVLHLDDCLKDDSAMIAQVVALELERPVHVQSATQASERAEVSVICSNGTLELRSAGPGVEKARALDVRRISPKARARTVALAVVELVEGPSAPEPAAPAPVTSLAPSSDRAQREAPARASLAVLGTTRFFPSTSDLTGGARLRSTMLRASNTALLLGVGVERASASREAGSVSVSAAFGELGVTRDVWRVRSFTLALEAVVEGGFVSLVGRPERTSDTRGQHLTAGWGDVGLALAPRLKLSSLLELSSRLAAGWMLVAPDATGDGRGLDLWRGGSLSADLGLSLRL